MNISSNKEHFTKDAFSHTTCHHELTKDEIWLGNTGTKIPEYCKGQFKTMRLGEQAYCIHGKPLSRYYCRPLIVNKSEAHIYERIYLEKMKAINEGKYFN